MTARTRTLALAVLGTIALSGCSSQIAANELGLRFNSGSIEGKSFEKVVEPGGVEWPVNDDIYRLPLGERSFIIRVDKDDDPSNDPDINGVLTVPVSGGPKGSGPDGQSGSALVDFEVSTAFALNTHTGDLDPQVYPGGTAQKFFEKLCKHYDCELDSEGNITDGWRKLLREKFYPALEAAFKDEVRTYDPDKLVDNVDGVLTELQDKVGVRFLEYLEKQTGGKFFCGPSFDRTKPDCPTIEMLITSADYNNPKVREAREAAKVAKLNSGAQSELETALQDPNYLEYLRIQVQKSCAESPNGNCTLVTGNTPVSIPMQPRQ